MKRIVIVLCGLLVAGSVFSATNVLKDSDQNKDFSYVTLTNNTDKNMQVETTLITTDTSFTRDKDWGATIETLKPYESKEVLWFSRDPDVKAGQEYQFNVSAKLEDNFLIPTTFTFNEVGKSPHGSLLNIDLTLPYEIKKPILTQDGLEKFNGQFWGDEYSIYARSWLPDDSNYRHFHLVIDKHQENSFDTQSNQKISVLTYNTQLMPFYAEVVDDLNQPKIRVEDIPAKISQFDVVILEELFDHDLRSTMTKRMQPQYPYHTKVVDGGNAKVLTGGVMIFSKWPIVLEKQVVYKASASGDSLAAKGAIYAEINKEGKIYHIFGTHLQAGGDDSEKQARQKQIVELNNFIASLNIPATDPVLIGGDFNVNQFGGDINMLLNTLNVTLFDNIGYKYSFDGNIDTMAVSKNHSRLDYVFYHALHAEPKVVLNKVFIIRDLDNEKMWPKFDLSDHFTTAGYFDFSS